MKIVAEGVETAAELRTVIELGADLLQGYFLARPAIVPGAIAPEAVARQCSCGKQGCLEAYASIKALRLKISETLDIDSDISGQELREKIIPANREKVLQDIHTYIEYLKTGICNYIDIFEPEVVCFGVSFAYWKETALYKQLISEIMEPNATFNSAKPEFCTAEYNNDAGIIGATIIE